MEKSNCDYFVSFKGDDVKGDGSLEKPWATIRHAFDQVPEGKDPAIIYICRDDADTRDGKDVVIQIGGDDE